MSESRSKQAVSAAETGVMAALSGGASGTPMAKVFLADLVGLSGCAGFGGAYEPGG